MSDEPDHALEVEFDALDVDLASVTRLTDENRAWGAPPSNSALYWLSTDTPPQGDEIDPNRDQG